MLLIVTLLATTLSAAQAARVLAVFPLGAQSHHYYLQSVARTLVKAGHEVEIYSPFPDLLGESPTNLTHFELKGIEADDQSKQLFPVFEEITTYPFWRCLDLFWTNSTGLYKTFIRDREIRNLLSSGKQFDLIIAEPFILQEFSLIFAQLFKAPIIGLQAFPTNNLLNLALGNPLSTSYIPDICSSFSNKMGLMERTLNTLSSLRGLYYHHTSYYRLMDNAIWEDFPSMPSVVELAKNISLVFVNDHQTADYAQPRTPNIIPVGGIHIQPPKPLPQNISEFMGNATDGVIFFSLGTYVPDDLKPKEYFDMYINIFKQLKQRVIWKTRKVHIEGLPDNVMITRWAPQREILAHPSCVLFITHGGQSSLLETIHFGVPVVSIPQFFDQHRNSEYYVQKGVGVKVPIEDVSVETMSKAINTVLGNPSYRENMRRLSAIFRDRPLSPAESVVFWTEYVLRHGGAAHLRPASTELRWYQLVLLDVMVLVSISSTILVYVLFSLAKTLLPYLDRIKIISSSKKID